MKCPYLCVAAEQKEQTAQPADRRQLLFATIMLRFGCIWLESTALKLFLFGFDLSHGNSLVTLLEVFLMIRMQSLREIAVLNTFTVLTDMMTP